MIRTPVKKLLQGKQNQLKKPLILQGARQVGKTWLMKAFAEQYYQHHIYINFEQDKTVHALFEQNLVISQILAALAAYTGKPIELNSTLIIFDEIQECPSALTSLKYFEESGERHHILAAGSLLGVALHQNTSFPVGKVEFLNVYPMSFGEFLEVMGEAALLAFIREKEWDMVKVFTARLTELLRTYMFIGGMPEVVKHFLEHRDFHSAREVQQQILNAYELDFSKHAPSEIVPRIRMIWESFPSQLGKENKKFIYGIIREGARAKDYELALNWLVDAGLLHKVSQVSKPAIPLKAYRDLRAFKLYTHDVGILGALCNLHPRSVLQPQQLFNEYKGYLTEQFVLQQLVAVGHKELHYWSSDTGRAEVDFVLENQGLVHPVEVKASENLKAKSMKVYHDKFAPSSGIRFSLSSYNDASWITNIPLYALAIPLAEIISSPE
jgi:predicted AAA+ superfamily ATPase